MQQKAWIQLKIVCKMGIITILIPTLTAPTWTTSESTTVSRTIKVSTVPLIASIGFNSNVVFYTECQQGVIEIPKNHPHVEHFRMHAAVHSIGCRRS